MAVQPHFTLLFQACKSPPDKKTQKVCRKFNRFISAHCEQANNKCSAGRLHKCSKCNKWGCTAVRHKESRARSLVADLQPSDSSTNQITPGYQDTAIFGLPANTNPAGTLQDRHILWTPVISAGEQLPLPLNSCCSVSLVSRSHADLVASKCPQSKYQSLEKPIAVSVADSQSQLQAIGTKEIPIQRSNGKTTTFKMLVVFPGPSYLAKIIYTPLKPWWIMRILAYTFDTPACPSRFCVPFRIHLVMGMVKAASPMLALPAC